jgi:predicted anti-sigma-YlaC factor YlaD
MRCEEIQERFVDLIYSKKDVPPEDAEIQEHLRTCSACRDELAELKQTRNCLQLWKDESPLRSVAAARHKTSMASRFRWKYLRYAAIAAMLILCILAIANTQIAWNKDGFSISTHIFPVHQQKQDYFTKAEVVDLVKQALDDSERRSSELNNLMMQRMLDTVEQDRWMDLRLYRKPKAQYQNKN